ncbi:hypothetical protein Tco_0873304 [Tanacetum coccineum]
MKTSRIANVACLSQTYQRLLEAKRRMGSGFDLSCYSLDLCKFRREKGKDIQHESISAYKTVNFALMFGVRDKDEGKSHAGTLIDIHVFVGSFSIISGFTIIDDDDMTKDVMLGMKFCEKYTSCQRIMKRFALGKRMGRDNTG